ncbi:MAG: hypothetical protein KAS32_05195 [Candidatus Peribacteraceae bacterium]|nr:hypothetical protein [Candidatus Peribacteraceae bacterium]
MADLSVSQGDFGFYINFTVLNDDDTPFNLTGYTITIKVWTEAQRPIALFTGVCAPVVAASGTCRYLVVAGDLDTSGAFKLELEMTAAGEEISTRSYDLNITGSA